MLSGWGGICARVVHGYSKTDGYEKFEGEVGRIPPAQDINRNQSPTDRSDTKRGDKKGLHKNILSVTFLTWQSVRKCVIRRAERLFKCWIRKMSFELCSWKFSSVYVKSFRTWRTFTMPGVEGHPVPYIIRIAFSRYRLSFISELCDNEASAHVHRYGPSWVAMVTHQRIEWLRAPKKSNFYPGGSGFFKSQGTWIKCG